MTEEEIKDRMKKICICKSISKGTILDAIKDGASTYEEVQKRTGAGSGACKGGRCAHVIKELLESN